MSLLHGEAVLPYTGECGGLCLGRSELEQEGLYGALAEHLGDGTGRACVSLRHQVLFSRVSELANADL